MAEIDRDRLVGSFLELVRIDSPSLHEQRIHERLMQEMRSLGLEVSSDGTGSEGVGNIIGLLRGSGIGKSISISAHFDTVEPGRGIKPVIDGDTIRSDGTTILAADCKAGLAAILEAVRVVQQSGTPHGDVEVLFTHGEERSLVGASALDLSRLRSRLGFIADSTNPPGALIVEAPSQDRFHAVFVGKAAHSGAEPEKGINALKAAATAIYHMPLGRIDEETTANIGLIKGGIARNVVPDRVELEGEARSRSNEKLDRQSKAMVDALNAASQEVGTRLELSVQRQYHAYRLDRQSPGVQLAWEAAERAGLTPSLQASGGGTDANIYNARGIPAVVIGIGMKQPHSLEEHIAIKDLVKLTRHLIAIIEVAAQQ